MKFMSIYVWNFIDYDILIEYLREPDAIEHLHS